MLGNRRVFDCSCFRCTEVVDKLRTSFLRGESSLTSLSTSVCQRGIYKATARALQREKQPNKMASTRSFAVYLRLSSTQRHGQKPNNCMKLGQKVVKRLVGVRTPLGPHQQCPVPRHPVLVTRVKEGSRLEAFSLPCSVPVKPVVSGRGAHGSSPSLEVVISPCCALTGCAVPVPTRDAGIPDQPQGKGSGIQDIHTNLQEEHPEIQ